MSVERLRNQDHGEVQAAESKVAERSREDEIENPRQAQLSRLAAATALNRILEKPHITGIAVSGTLGMGLFVRIGVMISLCGGAGTVIAYCIAGMIITCVMLCLSEMVSFMHSAGVIFDFPSKFVSPALGFAVGIIYWLSYTTSIVTLTAAATELLEFSVKPDEIGKATYSASGRKDSAVTMIVMIFIIFCINVIGGVKIYARIEWFVKWFKLSIVLSLWIVMIYIITSNLSTVGTLYWRTNQGFSSGFNSNLYGTLNGTTSSALPAPSADYAGLEKGLQDLPRPHSEISGPGGVIVAIITAVNEAVFSFIGVEILVVAAGEAKNPRRDLPKATSQMYILTIGLYVVTAILVSFCVSWDDPMLESYNSSAGYVGASNSPFIIAMVRGGMGEKAVNTYKALFFLSAATTINTNVYVASRTLFALFSNAPKFPWLQSHIGRTTYGRKTPFWAISLSIAPAFLAVVSLIQRAGTEVINVFSTIASVAMLCVFTTECYTFIYFQKGLGDRRSASQYNKRYNRIQLQPFWAWAGLVSCSVLILINGWYFIFAAAQQTMAAKYVVAGLIASYFGPLLFLGLFGLYVWKYQGKENIDVWNARSKIIEDDSADDELKGWKAWRHKLWMLT